MSFEYSPTFTGLVWWMLSDTAITTKKKKKNPSLIIMCEVTVLSVITTLASGQSTEQQRAFCTHLLYFPVCTILVLRSRDSSDICTSTQCRHLQSLALFRWKAQWDWWTVIPFHRTKCARTPQSHTHGWKHFVRPWLNSKALILQLIWVETNKIKI